MTFDDSRLDAPLDALAERVLRQATAIASLAVTQFEFGIGDPQRLARIEAGVVVQPLVEEA